MHHHVGGEPSDGPVEQEPLGECLELGHVEGQHHEDEVDVARQVTALLLGVIDERAAENAASTAALSLSHWTDTTKVIAIPSARGSTIETGVALDLDLVVP